MTDVVVRKAEPSDLSPAAALYSRVASQVLHWEPPETHTPAVFLSQIKDETLWVAVAADRVIGIAALYEPDSFLHSLFVDTEWQGQGVGKALLDVAATASSTRLSLKVQDRNEGAIRFYVREGFRPVDQGETNGSGWTKMRRF